MPKFEKVDTHTIRIIVEKADDVPLAQLLNNRKQLLEQKKVVEETLKNIDEILVEAKKLGIVAKELKKDLPDFIVDGICKKDTNSTMICNLGYACDACPYNKDVKKWKLKKLLGN